MKTIGLLTFFIFFIGYNGQNKLSIKKESTISLIGGNLGSRMMNYGYFETELNQRYPTKNLTIRNMCDGGDTPGFRPHPGRQTPWAFPGAENYHTYFKKETGSKGHFETPDQWLTRLKTDIIIGFFGFSESFEGTKGLDRYKGEIDAFISHSLSQEYNGSTPPQLALVSPIAFQDLSAKYDLPDGTSENKNLELYSNAIKQACQKHNIIFIDAFKESKKWYSNNEELTIDGSQLNEKGYQLFSKFLADQLLSKKRSNTLNTELKKVVLEKNWYWQNDYKIPNGVHVYGRRYNPFGPANYPFEIKKTREFTSIRDTLIWCTAQNKAYDTKKADQYTSKLPEVKTNYKGDKDGKYLYGKEALDKFNLAPGFQIELFASEENFPDLANPSQVSFDNKGRLWVAVMPTYPAYKVGDNMPNDKLLILEDTDGDNKADKQTIFADNLHIPAGFEIAPEGVYVSQGTNLVLLKDTDNDDHADSKEILLSGFDDHDTHHVISAFCADPSGAIYMGEGVFLHSNVETSYGTIRGTNGGFQRYQPQQKKLERTAQISIPNPWGIAFDKWGQIFYAETSGPAVGWMTPATIKPKYGYASPKTRNLIEEDQRVRPTSGLEIVSSRNFPDELQGDLMINNTIGFLGTKIHQFIEDGTGYKTQLRLDLVTSTDPNFRPVDMEFAPDGSLYLADWHNVLIGHMQHNARDPLRDHQHGRIYRITYTKKPLVKPALVENASINQLLENLKLPEYRTKYRSRRELRGRDSKEVITALNGWASNLDPKDPDFENLLLEALWVSWGANDVQSDLLNKALNAKNFKIRAAAVKVLRYDVKNKNQYSLLLNAASDDNSRVRMEVLTAATWLPKTEAKTILDKIGKQNLDDWTLPHYNAARFNSLDELPEEEKTEPISIGKEIFEKDGFCATCHQVNGTGIPLAGFPPLGGSKWVTENPERLIKLVLNGIQGPMVVKGKTYPGQVPMTPFRNLIKNDNELAAVLTYIRSSFGNSAPAISAETVKKVREETKNYTGTYTAKELLETHPHKK